MASKQFNPNRLTFQQGLDRIRQVTRRIGLNVDRGVVTSRDRQMPKALEALRVTNVPAGFQKWQLPVALRCESQMFITVAQPGARAGNHSHKEGAGIRFIAGGSIVYKGKELTAGDWMYIPAGARYSFEVGPYGAIMCYCYCCCCA
jgi:hypothetical protein